MSDKMILHAITWHGHEASCTSHCLRLHVLGGQQEQEKRRDWEIILGTLQMTHIDYFIEDLWNDLCFLHCIICKNEDIFGRWPCQNCFDLVFKFSAYYGCGSFREISVGHRVLIFALSCTSLRRLKLMQQCLEQIGLCPNPEMINLPWRVCSLSKKYIFLTMYYAP